MHCAHTFWASVRKIYILCTHIRGLKVILPTKFLRDSVIPVTESKLFYNCTCNSDWTIKQQPYVVTNITSWLDVKVSATSVNHILNTEHELLLCSVLRGNIEYTGNVLFYFQAWNCTLEIKITNRSYLLLGYLRLKVC